MNPVIVVPGMHRAGTSAIAQVLIDGGGWAGDPTELLVPDANNPRGFAERLDVVDLHDAWLKSFGCSWELPPVHDALASREPERTAEALGLLASLAATTERPLVLKDPRMALFLPTWLDAAPDARIVLPIRHPIEVAESLWTRDQMPIGHAVALWEKYVRESLSALKGRDVVLVNFTQLALLAARRGAAYREAITRLLALVQLDVASHAPQAADALDGQLVHQTLSDDRLTALEQTSLPPSAAHLWRDLAQRDVVSLVDPSTVLDDSSTTWWALDRSLSQWKSAGSTLTQLHIVESLMIALRNQRVGP